MTFSDGEYQEDSVADILEAMIADAKEYFGSDLKTDEEAVIRTFYRPIAETVHALQIDVGLVLQSTQIDNATGTRLELLTALIGIKREDAQEATGTVTFSRDDAATRDYTVPEGTVVQTDSNDPSKYEVTDSVTLAEGTTSVDASIESEEAGVDHNSGANTVVIMPDPPSGIEAVTNAAEITGGKDPEPDDELRARAQGELADGSRASAPALLNSTKRLDGVTSVSIFINDSNTDNTGSGGLPDHSFEMVTAGGNKNEIAQALLDTKAAGDTSYGGANGSLVTATADLPNGQTHDIDFSRPNEVQIYVDMDIEVTDEYEGDDAIRDSIVNYIGGLLATGNEDTGELGVGDNVLHGEVEYAIRDIEGVYEVSTLYIDTSSGPTSSTNITIADSDVSVSDATDGSITLTTTQI